MYTQCHRSTDKQNATKVVHRSRLFDQVCAWGGGGKPPPPPQPNPLPPLKPSRAEPSQARPSQFKGRPVYLPSPPPESPEFPTLSLAKPTRSEPSRARPLFLTVLLPSPAMPSPYHFFQCDHVYESPPSLFRTRNPPAAAAKNKQTRRAPAAKTCTRLLRPIMPPRAQMKKRTPRLLHPTAMHGPPPAPAVENKPRHTPAAKKNTPRTCSAKKNALRTRSKKKRPCTRSKKKRAARQQHRKKHAAHPQQKHKRAAHPQQKIKRTPILAAKKTRRVHARSKKQCSTNRAAHTRSKKNTPRTQSLQNPLIKEYTLIKSY